MEIRQKFVQALPSDNPYLSSQYIDVLKESFRHRPELLRAYLYGDWNALEGPDQVIKDEWLESAMTRFVSQPVKKRFLVCDPARFGDDETVIDDVENFDILEQVIMPYCRTTQISSRLAAMSYANDDCTIVVESIGADIGAGVIDELTEMGKNVIQYNPAAKSAYPERYYNLRAEAWSEGAKALCDGMLGDCVIMCHNLDETTRTQLCLPTYDFRAGKIIIKSKKKIKEDYGRSPDRGDAYIMVLWAWPLIEAPQSAGDWGKRHKRAKSPMRV